MLTLAKNVTPAHIILIYFYRELLLLMPVIEKGPDGIKAKPPGCCVFPEELFSEK
jgi:hypothetical protein